MPTEVGQQVLERLQAGQSLTSDEAIKQYTEVAVAAGTGWWNRKGSHWRSGREM